MKVTLFIVRKHPITTSGQLHEIEGDDYRVELKKISHVQLVSR